MIYPTLEQYINRQITALMLDGKEPTFLYVDSASFAEIKDKYDFPLIVVSHWGNPHAVVSNRRLSPMELKL